MQPDSAGVSKWWVVVGLLALAVVYDASAEWGGVLLIILVFGMLLQGKKSGALTFPNPSS
jgi:hypothetical protein